MRKNKIINLSSHMLTTLKKLFNNIVSSIKRLKVSSGKGKENLITWSLISKTGNNKISKTQKDKENSHKSQKMSSSRHNLSSM